MKQKVATPKNSNKIASSLGIEFYSWLKKFNIKYKKALRELAKK